MIIPKIIVWSFVTIVSTVNARIIGKQWGWGRALKPNGLNTIVLKRSVFFHQHHSNSEGEQVARLLGEVSTSVTSRAIMDIITLANGHSPISCSQEELEEMESEYETCVNKHQYKLKCFNLSKDQQCKTITDFLEECTDRILGQCLESPFSSYISHVQTWSLSRRTGLKEVCFPTDNSRIPNISHFLTEAPPVMDRATILRRYLRHPALAN